MIKCKRKYCKPSVEIVSFENETVNMMLVSGNYNSVNLKESNTINSVDF